MIGGGKEREAKSERGREMGGAEIKRGKEREGKCASLSLHPPIACYWLFFTRLRLPFTVVI